MTTTTGLCYTSIACYAMQLDGVVPTNAGLICRYTRRSSSRSPAKALHPLLDPRQLTGWVRQTGAPLVRSASPSTAQHQAGRDLVIFMAAWRGSRGGQGSLAGREVLLCGPPDSGDLDQGRQRDVPWAIAAVERHLLGSRGTATDQVRHARHPPGSARAPASRRRRS